MIPRPATSYNLSVSFLVALICANVCGPQYVYPIVGTALTTKFHWSALENSLVSTACFVGVSFSGPVCSAMIEHLGIATTLRLSALFAFMGQFLLAQTYAGRLPSSFALCALYLVCTGFAGAAAYLCTLDSQAHNFRTHRGMSMGITSASIGLCGLVYSQINDHFFKDEQGDDEHQMYLFLVFFAFAMAGGMLLGSFFLGPLDFGKTPSVVETAPLLHSDDTPMIGNSIQPQHRNKDEEAERDEPCLSGLDFFTHPVGFALFVTLFIGLGLGYVYLASIGPILLALPSAVATSNAQHLRNIHVSTFSIANCASRAGFGTLSDILKSKFGVHRIWVFWAALVGLTASLFYLVTGVTTPETLLPCTISVAVVYGIVFGVAPATTSEFGTDVFARNWGWLLFAPAIGSQSFNILFGALYDRQAKRQGVDVCQGTICFRRAFEIGIMASVVCLLVISWAIVKMRLYNRIAR